MSGSDARAREKGLAIQILGREFRVSCPEGEEERLEASVEFVNRHMRDLRDNGKVTGNERIAIMAALNIAHELLAAKPARAAPSPGVDEGDIRRRIVRIQETLDSALAADQDKLF